MRRTVSAHLELDVVGTDLPPAADGQVRMLSQEVTATIDGDLPIEDWSENVELR